jgi:hypothetical protein
MTEYKPNSQLKFGMYKGSTIENISNFNFNYISWCIANLDHFYISEETIEMLGSKIKGFRLKEDAIATLEIKRSQMYNSKTSDDYEYDNYDRRTYDDYNGSYAQDQMGWSDQDINDVFGGDADAYWNID